MKDILFRAGFFFCITSNMFSLCSQRVLYNILVLSNICVMLIATFWLFMIETQLNKMLILHMLDPRYT